MRNWTTRKCGWTREMSLLASGDLSAERATAVRRHLEKCRDCRDYLEDLEQTCHLFRRSLTHTPAETSASFRQSWVSAVRAVPRSAPAGSFAIRWSARLRHGLNPLTGWECPAALIIACVWLIAGSLFLMAPAAPDLDRPTIGVSISELWAVLQSFQGDSGRRSTHELL